MSKPRCPECDCPERFCACVLLARTESAERDRTAAEIEAYRYRTLFHAAAALIAHNRDRLRKPRGADEQRVLDYLDEYGDGPPGLGALWSGKTDGWMQGWMLEDGRGAA